MEDREEPQQIGQTTENTALIGTERLQYLSWLKGIRQLEGESDPTTRRDLTPYQQSLLYLLRNIESLNLPQPNQVVRQQMECLEKVPLSQAIATQIGHRPNSVVFSSIEWQNDEIIQSVETFLQRGAVYIKKNRGFRGEDVVQILKTTNGYLVIDGFGKQIEIPAIKDYKLPGTTTSEELFIAEEEIQIAHTLDDRTWELRLLPPFPSEYCYAKVAQSTETPFNNISRGGERQNAMVIIRDVIRTRYPNLADTEIQARAVSFMTQSVELSTRTKELTDRIQIEIAKGLITPDDLKDPKMYEEIMQDCFRGTFLSVDITGTWDKQGNLQPIVMETQTSAKLPGEKGFIIMDRKLFDLKTPLDLAYSIYEDCLTELNLKVSRIQTALK